MGAGSCKSSSSTQVRPQTIPTAWGTSTSASASAVGGAHAQADNDGGSSSLFPSICVLGFPGAGKSTFVQWAQSGRFHYVLPRSYHLHHNCCSGSTKFPPPPSKGKVSKSKSRTTNTSNSTNTTNTSSAAAVSTTIPFEGRMLRWVDVSGGLPHRRLWPTEAKSADALVFMLDTSDRIRLPLAWAEVLDLVSAVPRVQQIPLLLCFNKIDLNMTTITKTSTSSSTTAVAQIREIMATMFTPILHTNWCIAEMSLRTGEGVSNALAWLLPRCHKEPGRLPSADGTVAAAGVGAVNVTAITALSDVSVMGGSTLP